MKQVNQSTLEKICRFWSDQRGFGFSSKEKELLEGFINDEINKPSGICEIYKSDLRKFGIVSPEIGDSTTKVLYSSKDNKIQVRLKYGMPLIDFSNGEVGKSIVLVAKRSHSY